MSLLIRLIPVDIVVVGITDTIVFFKLRNNPALLTGPWAIAVIFIKVLPMAIILWKNLA